MKPRQLAKLAYDEMVRTFDRIADENKADEATRSLAFEHIRTKFALPFVAKKRDDE